MKYSFKFFFFVLVSGMVCSVNTVFWVTEVSPEETLTDGTGSETASIELFNLQLIQEIKDPLDRAEALRNHLARYPDNITSEIALLNLLLLYERDLSDTDRADKTAWRYLEGLNTSECLKTASAKFLLAKNMRKSTENIEPVMKVISRLNDPALISYTSELLSKRGIFPEKTLQLLDKSDLELLKPPAGVNIPGDTLRSIRRKIMTRDALTRARVLVRLGHYSSASGVLDQVNPSLSEDILEKERLRGLIYLGMKDYKTAFEVLSGGFYRTWGHDPGILLALEQLYLAKNGNLGNLENDLEEIQLQYSTGKMEFTLKDLTGMALSSKDFEGKTLVILVWASWDEKSRDALQMMDAFAEESRFESVAFLGVNMDADIRLAARFLEEHQYHFRNVRDSDDFKRQYQINDLPEIFLVNNRGIIRHRFTGYNSYETGDNLKRKLKHLLRHGPQAILPIEVNKELARAYFIHSRENESVLPDDEYRQILSRGVELDSRNPELLNELAWFYATRNTNIDEAIKLSRKSLRHDKSNIAYMDTLAELYFLKGKTGKAIETVKDALLLQPDNAMLLERLEKYENAMEGKNR